MSRANLGLNALNRPGVFMPPQSGTGVMDWIKAGKKAYDAGLNFAKKHKLVTKIGNVVDAVGATGYLDSKTKGLFSKGVAEGKKRGYGKKKSGGGKKRKSRR